MVAVVNEAFARRSFGDRNPLGQHMALGQCPKCDIEIVGVSANTLYGNLKGKAPPTVYLPFAQGGWRPVQGMVYELRTAGNPLNYVRAVRDLVQRADQRLPLSELKSQSAWIDQAINQEITFARLCTAFAILALAIACVGLYGAMSYRVARRTGEIGIRMALGAQREPGSLDGPSRGGSTGGRRARDQRANSACGVKTGGIVSVRNETERSAGFDRISGDPGDCGDSGWLPACPKSVSNRSDDRAAARVTIFGRFRRLGFRHPISWSPEQYCSARMRRKADNQEVVN